MTIRLIPDLLKSPEPLTPSPEARMRQAMGLPPRWAMQPWWEKPNRPLTAEEEVVAGWLRHRCGREG